jgi:SAM-dependent methyltransferase
VASDIKQTVREFYNQVGWQEVAQGVYQNAAYEDLRPVSREYIHRCHVRVGQRLAARGRYLLDAGSGPIQYPEYLEYSKGYRARVCADISMVALQAARKRIGDAADGGHGLFVVCDIAHLPFKADTFDGVVSLHTIHHLPSEEHPRAYGELYRVMASGAAGVIVNGWGTAPLANLAKRLVRHSERASQASGEAAPPAAAGESSASITDEGRTFTRKTSAAWLKREIGSRMPLEIRVWRTFSVKFLRAFIHERRGGRFWLRLLYWLEERFPQFLGENGQYPMVIIRKKSG